MLFQNLDSVLYLFDLLGVAVFAIRGALSAGRKGLDLLGVIVISIVTSIGGGTIRDVLLGHHPIFWIKDPTYVLIIIIASVFTLFYIRFNKPPFNALLIADAIGLAFFTITGTQIAESAGLHPILIIIMGTITGTAGGVLRDVLSAEIPLILKRDIYATAAISGSIVYLLAEFVDIPNLYSALLGIITVVILRALAIIWGIRLPVFKLSDDN